MIATSNFNSTEPTTGSYGEDSTGSTYFIVSEPVMNTCYGSNGPSISPDCFLKPINLLHEDEFFEEICKKSIRMESKRFIPPPITNINRGRG